MIERDTRKPNGTSGIGRKPTRLLPRPRRWSRERREKAKRTTEPWLARRRLGRRLTSSSPRQPNLLSQEPFRLFWLSRLITQTAQGALVYALLIIVVDKTDASFYNSLFVICAIIPSLAFGLPAGVVVDALPRRPFMVVLNGLRFVFAISLIQREPSLTGIFAAALGIWTIHQFYSPAESSLMAALVPRHRYTSAQALSNLALTLSQLFGLVILAPLLLKTVGPPTLFAMCAMFFMIGALLLVLLPGTDEKVERSRAPRVAGATFRETLFNGWYASRHDSLIYEVMIDDILVGIGASALLVITPLYLKGVLNTGAENTVFVFAPAALGLVIGLRLTPKIDGMIGERAAATLGLMLFAACVGALGFVEWLRLALNESMRIPTDRVAEIANVPPLILIVMLLSVPAGFASSVVSVSARSVLLGRTPPALRGQVIATQSLLQNVGALVPTLLAGVAADLIGVERVAVAIAALMTLGAIAALTVYRPAPRPAPSISPHSGS
jgi:MFS family permease